MFILSDKEGIVYNFEIYAKKIVAFEGLPDVALEGLPDLGASGNNALKLAQVVLPDVNQILCFHNWFTTINLIV